MTSSSGSIERMNYGVNIYEDLGLDNMSSLDDKLSLDRKSKKRKTNDSSYQRRSTTKDLNHIALMNQIQIERKKTEREGFNVYDEI